MVNWGLLVLYFFTAFGLGVAVMEHGQKKKGTHNAFINLGAYIVQLVLIWWALGWRFI